MKILIRNVDNVVIYAQADLVLSDTELTGDSWRDPHFNTLNARIEEADLPAGWAGGVFSYGAGVWSVFDQVRHAEIVQATAAKARMAIFAEYDNALTNHLDAVAFADKWGDQQRGARIYCALRAGFPGPWQAKGVAFGTWMDTCNALAYKMLDDFEQGLIPQPTIGEMIAALPPMVWP